MESEEFVTIDSCENKKDDESTGNNFANKTQELRRSTRNKSKPDRLGYNIKHHAHSVITFPITTVDEPSVNQAMKDT